MFCSVGLASAKHDIKLNLMFAYSYIHALLTRRFLLMVSRSMRKKSLGQIYVFSVHGTVSSWSFYGKGLQSSLSCVAVQVNNQHI